MTQEEKESLIKEMSILGGYSDRQIQQRIQEIEELDAGNARLDELINLVEWKKSAMKQLASWDQVWEALGKPGTIGEGKVEACLAEIRKLKKDAQATG